jgi:hypothetical protein
MKFWLACVSIVSLFTWFASQASAAVVLERGSCKSSFDCFGALACYKGICTTFEEVENKEGDRKKRASSTDIQSRSGKCTRKSDCPKDKMCAPSGKCETRESVAQPKESAQIINEDHKYARFQAPYKGNHILLWVTPTVSSQCGDWGGGYAEERAVMLNEYKTVRELCYRINQSKKMIEFKDPEKNFFNNTFSISSDAFYQRKWPSEIEVERREAEWRAQEERLREFQQRVMENNARVPAPVYIESPRMPISCIHMGDMSTCY